MMKLCRRILIFFCLCLMLTGCGLDGQEKGRKAGSDWSKGFPLTTAVTGSVGMAVENDGERLHLAWMENVPNEDPFMRYVQLDANAVFTVDTKIQIADERTRAPRLLVGEDGRIYLLWVSRPAGSGWELWLGQLDGQGDLVGDPIPLSTEEMNVGSYALNQNEAGRGFVVWEDNEANGIFGLEIDEAVSSRQPQQLTQGGESPAMQVDDAGNVHLAWRRGLDLYYALFPDGELTITEGTAVAEFRMSQSDSLGGPAVGVTENLIYLVWSVFRRTGLEANTGRTEFVSFSATDPQKSVSQRLAIPSTEEPPYVPIESRYNLTELAPPAAEIYLGSDFTIEPSAANSQGNDLALSVATMQQNNVQQDAQIATLLFRDGRFLGYQMATKTQNFSADSTLLSDNAGHLYVTWHDGGGNRLFYATTEPVGQAAIDQVTGSDVAGAMLAASMQATVGLLLFPFFGIGWLLFGGVFLGLVRLRRSEDSMSMTPVPNITTIVLLIIAILFYQTSKILFLPTILEYVPFSAWVDISSSTGQALRLIVPLAVFGISLAIAEVVRRRRAGISAILYYVVLCGVDALFSLAIYGVNFMGIF